MKYFNTYHHDLFDTYSFTSGSEEEGIIGAGTDFGTISGIPKKADSPVIYVSFEFKCNYDCYCFQYYYTASTSMAIQLYKTGNNYYLYFKFGNSTYYTGIVQVNTWIRIDLVIDREKGIVDLYIDRLFVHSEPSTNIQKNECVSIKFGTYKGTSTKTVIRNLMLTDEGPLLNTHIREVPFEVVSSEWENDGSMFSTEEAGKKFVLKPLPVSPKGMKLKSLTLAGRAQSSDTVGKISVDMGGGALEVPLTSNVFCTQEVSVLDNITVVSGA